MLRVLLLIVAILAFPSIASAEEEAPVANVRARFGDGVSIRSDDGNFALKLRARIQVRWTGIDDAPDEGAAEELLSPGFQIRRQRLVLSGHAFDESLQYYIQYGFSDRDMEGRPVPLRDAYVTWKAGSALQIRFGQMKVPFSRQRVISSSALMFVDRSLANAELNLDRDVGIQLRSRDLLDGRLGYQLGLFGGEGRNRASTRAGQLWVARIEARPLGKFEDDEESDAEREGRLRIGFGFGIGHNVNTGRARSTFGDDRDVPIDYTHGEADLIAKFAGFSLQTEVIFRRAPESQSSIETEDGREWARNAWGWMTQAGYRVTSSFELGARYGEVRPRGVTDPEVRKERELGGVIGWYFQDHDLKLQADYFHLTRATEEGGTRERHQVRVQCQIFF